MNHGRCGSAGPYGATHVWVDVAKKTRLTLLQARGLVPLLHMVPSKNDQERLIPMSPERVKILLEFQRRTRGTSDTVPCPPGTTPTTRRSVTPCHTYSLDSSAQPRMPSCTKSSGNCLQALPPTPERRQLTSDIHTPRLPPAIRHGTGRFGTAAASVSTLLGHLNPEATRGYTAVFPKQASANSTRSRTTCGNRSRMGRVRTAFPPAEGRAGQLSPSLGDPMRS